MKNFLTISFLLFSAVCNAQFSECVQYKQPVAAVVGNTFDLSHEGTHFSTSTTTLAVADGAGVGEIRATGLILSGTKYFVEYVVTSGTVTGGALKDGVIGLDNGGGDVNQYTGANSSTYGAYAQGCQVGGSVQWLHSAGFFSGTGSIICYTIGDIIDELIDLVGNTATLYVNNVAANQITITSGSYYPAVGTGGFALSITQKFAPTTPTYTYAGYTQY